MPAVHPETEKEGTFPAARQEEVFSASSHFLLSRLLQRIDDPRSLLLQVCDVLTFYVELDVVVVSRKGPARLELLACPEPTVSQPNFEYFLKFCKQEILSANRFADLENLELSYLREPFSDTVTGGAPISSYLGLPLKDSAGTVFGILHLGSIRNHYFNETVAGRLRSLLPLLGSVLAQSFQKHDLKERKTGLLTLFAKFLPEPIIQRLLEEQRNSQNLAGRKARVVILFSDIRSFTAITERNGAEPVVQFLNRHFQAMVTQISVYGGVIDKFIGDAIVAVFEADADPSDACARAVRAARDMLLELPRVDVSSVVLDQGRYGIGVGLHMGDAVAGYIGSQEKTAYTVVGDVIERAEDLEAETKHYRVGLLMSHAVATALRDSDLPLLEVSENPDSNLEDRVFTLDLKR